MAKPGWDKGGDGGLGQPPGSFVTQLPSPGPSLLPPVQGQACIPQKIRPNVYRSLVPPFFRAPGAFCWLGALSLLVAATLAVPSLPPRGQSLTYYFMYLFKALQSPWPERHLVVMGPPG